MKRREFLRLGASTILGAALGGAVAGRAAHARSSSVAPRARACILLYMTGGPSQLDTFDPKPGLTGGAAVRAISTSVAGIRVAERLPLLARQACRYSIVRSIVSKEGNHDRARHLMHTGHEPAGSIQHPTFGAIVSAESPAGPLPNHVCIGGPGAPAGFLGAQHAPFVIAEPGRPVKNLGPTSPGGRQRATARIELGRELDDRFRSAHPDSAVAQNHREVTDAAARMMSSAEVVAFDLSGEKASTLTRYGETKFGRSCLMARRLVEVGVPFVEVMFDGWDTHRDHVQRVQPLCAALDQGMSALLEDLHRRGLLDETLVVWTGDFGRTPWLNANGGRDHYPGVTPAVLAGGGIRPGRTVGETSDDGRDVVEGAVTVADLYATVAACLGLDPDKKRASRGGRPISTVDGGAPIPGLV